MKNKELHKEIYKYLNHISNSVGKTITEYDWREVCGIMVQMEEEGLVEKQTHQADLDLASDLKWVQLYIQGKKFPQKTVEKW